MKKIVLALALILTLMVPSTAMAHGGHHHDDDITHCLNHSKMTMSVGKEQNLCIYRCCDGQKSKISSNITWKSNCKSVATVTKSGKVCGKAKGKAKITAVYKGKSYHCTVVVEKPYLSCKNIKLKKGRTYQLKVKGTCRKVTCQKNKNGIVTVSKKMQDGVCVYKIKACKAGKVRLRIKAGCDQVGSCYVTVK